MPKTESERKDKVSVSIRMPAEMYQALKILASAEERSLSKQIIYAIGEWMQMMKAQEGAIVIDKPLSQQDLDFMNSEHYQTASMRWISAQSPASISGTWISNVGASPSLSPSISPSPSYSFSPSASESPSAAPEPFTQITDAESSMQPHGGLTQYTVKFLSDEDIDIGEMVKSGNIKITHGGK